MDKPSGIAFRNTALLKEEYSVSMPNVPDIKPEIRLTRREALDLILTSIALEEIGISHILNAEGEKIQYALTREPELSELLDVNRGTERLLRNLIKKEMLLQFKLENVMDLERFGKSLVPDEDEDEE